MKMHIKNVHGSKPTRASKRLPNFTPIAKTSKRSKNVKELSMNLQINSEGILDESSFLVNDTFSGKENPLDEAVVVENKDEESPKTAVPDNNTDDRQDIQMTDLHNEVVELISCNECEFDTESDIEF